MAQLAVPGSAAVGATGTLILKNQFDQSGDTSLFRPSVLFGLGTGLATLAASFANSRGMLDVPGAATTRGRPSGPLYAYGIGATLSGLYSAFFPKGNPTFQLPSA